MKDGSNSLTEFLKILKTMKNLVIFNLILIFWNGAKNGENKTILFLLKPKMIV